MHVYLRHEGGLPSRRFAYGDVQAEGGQVAAPPTVHPSGVRYAWAVDPDDAPLAELTQLEPVLGTPTRPLTPRSYVLPAAIATPAAVGPNDGPADVDVGRLGHSREFVGRMLPTLGIPASRVDGRPFHCVLPGHAERNPSASLFQDRRTGVWKYRDWHERTPGVRVLTLAEVRAARSHGHVASRDRPEQASWYARLAHDADLITPAEVKLPRLPAGAPATVEAARAGFRLLVGLRWRVQPDVPVPFARGFAGAWSGITESQARTAIAELRRLGVIVQAGEHPSGYRRTTLYLPGTCSPPTRSVQPVDGP